MGILGRVEERKAAILSAVVEQYIDTAEPVGSAHVARSSQIDVSSATVRAEMAALEADGYLHQPHTSAGRVPTEAGYRSYVDSLTAPTELGRPDAHRVRDFFDSTHTEIEKLLAQTSALLSDLTDCAALVLPPPYEATTFRSVQLVGLSDRVALAVVVLANGVVEKHTLEFDEAVTDETLVRAGEVLVDHVAGKHATDLGNPPATDDGTVARVVAAALAALGGDAVDHDAEHVFVDGTARVAAAFDAIETVQEILGVLEKQLVVVTLLRDVVDRGLSVAIGAETGMPLDECSLVVSPYEVGGEQAGSIGVLGPTRMDYPQALAAVAVVSRRLGDRLTAG